MKDLRGWLDYDRDRLPALSPGERIDYFEKRVRKVAVNPLRRILTTEIVVEGEDSSALLIFGVSVCCAIEATGKFLTGGLRGKGANEKRFHAFLDGYMSAEFHSKTVGGLTYGEALWRHFRNGLAHGFAVCHGGFEGTARQPYFDVRRISGYECLEVNPTLFFNDYAAGFERYLADLRGAGVSDTLSVDFNSVFEKVFIRGE